MPACDGGATGGDPGSAVTVWAGGGDGARTAGTVSTPADVWSGVGGPVVVRAPAKLTVSLRVVGVRSDGFHLIDAEMVSIDLCDELVFEPGDGLHVVDEVVGGLGIGDVDAGSGNLVCRSLAAAGRRALVTLRKRIPVRAGLGGGSTDAAAALRWAGVADPDVAVRLGADVPFCLVGGRARVQGIGDVVCPLAYRDRRYVLLLPPVGVETAACYRAWDALAGGGLVPGAPADADGLRVGRGGTAGTGALGTTGALGATNDLEMAAVSVMPEMGDWRDALARATGRRPMLAGSGSTWFVEGTLAELGLQDRRWLEVDGRRAPLVAVRTVAPFEAGSTGAPPAIGTDRRGSA